MRNAQLFFNNLPKARLDSQFSCSVEKLSIPGTGPPKERTSSHNNWPLFQSFCKLKQNDNITIKLYDRKHRIVFRFNSKENIYQLNKPVKVLC